MDEEEVEEEELDKESEEGVMSGSEEKAWEAVRDRNGASEKVTWFGEESGIKRERLSAGEAENLRKEARETEEEEEREKDGLEMVDLRR